ncbi:hypothetical protein ACRRTK_021038 [Alexandromys fortis]
MSDQAPPTLEQLALETLLKKEALAISGFADWPWFLFPAEFERAFRNNQTNILRAMVPAWPFTCLPVGVLMKTPHLETLKALLDGLDVLITEEPCPSRGKIRVLDLTNRDSCVNRSQSCERELFYQITREKTVEMCPYSQRDLDYLPQCLNISALKHLDLSHTMLGRSIKPLGYLLERVKDTLETLDLAGCRLEDSQFSALMPALSQCSQLLKINLYMNDLSLPVLKQLLHHTAKLNKLTEETYPVPLEYYDGCRVLVHRFDELGPELLDILRFLKLMIGFEKPANPMLGKLASTKASPAGQQPDPSASALRGLQLSPNQRFSGSRPLYYRPAAFPDCMSQALNPPCGSALAAGSAQSSP